MTDESERARANEIHLEVKKDALAQRQSGDWAVRFTAQAADLPIQLLTAPMGTRYMCVLVEINDDERPVEHILKQREEWRNLGPVKQSALRCKDPIFWRYLEEEMMAPPPLDEELAATAVRSLCGVASRSHLGKPGYQEQRQAWYGLDNAFQAWKAREHA
jgi:hypothetical protein